MELRFAVVCIFALLPSVAAKQQPPPAAPATQTETTKVTCPVTPEGKTACFDVSLYLPLGNDVKMGHRLSGAEPTYSESARKAQIKGTVVLAVALNADGSVDAVKVVRPLEPSLDRNAVDAMNQWKFTPATRDGKPVAVQIEVVMGFNLY